MIRPDLTTFLAKLIAGDWIIVIEELDDELTTFEGKFIGISPTHLAMWVIDEDCKNTQHTRITLKDIMSINRGNDKCPQFIVH
jgi:hypothetical protein